MAGDRLDRACKTRRQRSPPPSPRATPATFSLQALGEEYCSAAAATSKTGATKQNNTGTKNGRTRSRRPALRTLLTSELLQHAGSLAEGAGSVDHVVHDDHVRVLHATDEVHAVHLERAAAAAAAAGQQRKTKRQYWRRPEEGEIGASCSFTQRYIVKCCQRVKCG